MSEQSTRTVERALSLLAHVCEEGSSSLAAAARAVELSPSTALRLLRTLEASGFVRRDDEGSYRAGSRLVQLGAQALSNESLIDISHQEMVGLEEATGESVYLSVEGHGASVLYISIVEGSHSIRHANWVGRTIPLQGSAAGLALTGQTPEAGFVVVERGIERDVTAIAAPILVGSRIVASLSILVPTYRIDDRSTDQFGRLIAAAAHRLSAGLTDPAPGPKEKHP
ncbi:IclR family transcriptional regulator [Microbacterium marinilacus]|uniref:IclR family transcriptional regulator n=1 Tax=Microbacterium marinilacus TaxID=415209 RepID=A0ABP7BS13_9MICO|nr:helix-turn-helix domain-containing protein [Microbacterium marinilacus]MBY0689110.1 helix-turn-helix domain-containing protein [Microbacterium marinilacus]